MNVYLFEVIQWLIPYKLQKMDSNVRKLWIMGNGVENDLHFLKTYSEHCECKCIGCCAVSSDGCMVSELQYLGSQGE